MKKYDNYLSNLAVLREAGKEDLSNEFILSGIIDKFYVVSSKNRHSDIDRRGEIG